MSRACTKTCYFRWKRTHFSAKHRGDWPNKSHVLGMSLFLSHEWHLATEHHTPCPLSSNSNI